MHLPMRIYAGVFPADPPSLCCFQAVLIILSSEGAASCNEDFVQDYE